MQAPLTGITAAAYTIPTDRPEADGTLAWRETTIVIVQVEAGGKKGIGYTYACPAAAVLIKDTLADAVKGKNAFDIPTCWGSMRREVRNLGLNGLVSAAISAVDTALWDLKARLLDISLSDLLGMTKDSIPVYGSGGFTTYSKREIESQIVMWRKSGMTMVKIKIGTHPDQDIARVAAARDALGDHGEVFVDANGAYSVKQALAFASRFSEFGVTWFEEPVTSDNLSGLRQIRAQGPDGMSIAAGEYCYDIFAVERLLAAEAVDILQLDATRCQGYSGFMYAASLALAANIPLSSHCAPALHLPVCCHVPHVQHMEFFYDHTRIENILFDGVPAVKNGMLSPDRRRPGNGLTLRKSAARRYAV